MNNRIQSRFIYSAAIILFITGAAKLISAFGAAQVLDQADSLLILKHRYVLFFMSGTELGLSAFLLMGRNSKIKLSLIAWLGTNFLMYRIGLWWMSAPNLCNCLGNLNEYLPISPRILNLVAFTALGWLLIGSYALMILGWRNRPVEVRLKPIPSKQQV
jgi:hypothetical protein